MKQQRDQETKGIRRFLRRMMVAGGASVGRRRLSGHGAVVLSYHNVVPAGEETVRHSGLHLPQGVFAAQLDDLARTHEVVPLPEILAAPSFAAPRPRVAITLNAAYSGALTAGMAELRARGMPVTILVSPGRLGGQAYWWDAVHRGDAPEFDAAAIRVTGGENARVRALAAASGLEIARVPTHARTCTEEELHAAAEWDGVTVGTHGYDHVNLTTLDVLSLKRELEGALTWIVKRFRRAAPYLALPYGLCNPLVAGMARRLGYRAGLLSTGGCIHDCMKRAAEGQFLVPRVQVLASVSMEDFALRAAGLGRVC